MARNGSHPTAGITIGLPEVYTELRRVGDGLLVLTGRVEGMTTMTNQVGDHETRIRSLEGRRWPLQVASGLMGAIGTITGAIALFQGLH